MKKWPHYAGDGRAPRDVFLNGKKLKGVLCADENRGVVKVVQYPIRLDKYRKRVLSKILRGSVRVEFKQMMESKK